MYLQLKCKRPSSSQNANGVLGTGLTDGWTTYLNVLPGDLTLSQQLRETGSDVDVVKKFNCFTGNVSLDILPGDMLVNIVEGVEVESYKVLGIQKWPRALGVLLEKVEE